MQVLKNSSIAVGIEWTLHDSISEAKKAASGKKKVLVVRKVISGECVQGICPTPPKAKRLQAGALLVASIANDILIYHNLGDGFAWVCAIREGIPLHGFDVVVDEIKAKATLAEVMSYVPSADIYGDVPGAKGSVAELFAKIAIKDRKAATLIAPDNPLLILALLAIIILLAGIAVFGMRIFDTKGTATKQTQSDEEMRRLGLSFNTEAQQARNIFWHARSPSQQFGLWYDVLRGLPVSVNGWAPSTFTCDVTACQVLWKRDARALPSSVTDLPGIGKHPSFDLMLKETTTSFPLLKLDPVLYAQGAGRTDQFLLDLSINAKQVTLALNPTHTSVTLSPPMAAQWLKPVTIGQEGVWRATGSNPLLIPEFLRMFELPGVVLNTLSIKNLNPGRSQYTIELEGRYRVGN